MKLRADLCPSVYGFKKIDADNKTWRDKSWYNPFAEGQDLAFLNADDYPWILEIGNERRLQTYYLLIDKERNLMLTASEPDNHPENDAHAVELPSVLMQMISEGVFE